MTRRTSALALVGVAAALALAVAPGTGDRAPATDAQTELPNLVPKPPFDLQLGPADDERDGVALRFAITTQNLGTGHLDLLGAPPRDVERTTAQQCVAWQGRACTQRHDVGDITFHAEHGHWHLDDYAAYRLHRLRADGTPDLTEAGVVVDGGKVSFCLIDTDRVGPTRPDDPFADTGFYTGCLGAFQGISAGWGDTYTAGLVGQQLLVDGVPDGDYAVVVTVDPQNMLLESDDTDNVAWALVRLTRTAVGVRR